MASTDLTFSDRDAHRAWLASQGALPEGFRVGVHRFGFTPVEAPKPAKMAVTLIALDTPTPAFAAMFTRNAFPGAPVLIGRQRLNQPACAALVINNKVSNVCAPGGVETAERVCAAAAAALGVKPSEIIPCSTGVIGWRLPEQDLIAALPDAAKTLSAASILPAAEGICTTDLYPKIRSRTVGAGRVVGIAKGAGMIEPNLATMLVYILTDCRIGRERLRAILREVVDDTFNCLSIDSDTSTSDTVIALSSEIHPVEEAAFAQALREVCADLSEDIVRNGEGVHHVMRVRVTGAPSTALARSTGKAVVNSPLFQCAVAGNDANVGRLVAAVGKHLGAVAPGLDLSRAVMRIGGRVIFAKGAFALDHDAERFLTDHYKKAEMYASVPPADGLTFRPPVSWPPHERAVEIDVDLGIGPGTAMVLGADRTHEYISENADYRS
ncbi:MAG: hypothetical protein RLZZ127_1103 [Planctomycetota bacterium]|jgi:glutamate N-acetyltransferase/amino-acid N-acetyltransferase